MSPGKGQTKVSYGPIVRCGHLRKIGSFMATWTPRRKYFVLRADAPGYPACLEYYDSKKKFEQQLPPKRSISMRSCYNINRRHDSRHKHVIVLYTKDDCFSIALETERELGQWLSDMLLLFGDVPDCPQPKRTFEHVWTVEAEKRGLCLSRNMIGSYNVCLTNKTVAIMKVSPEGTVTEHYEHEFGTVRRCGTMERILYLEVGRLAVGGSGEYWFKAEDVNISQNIHDTIMSALTGSAHKDKDDVVPQSRKRSSSANEASKPISFTRRRPTGSKAYGISPVEEQSGSNKDDASDETLCEQSHIVTASAPSQSCTQSQGNSSSDNTLTAVAGTRSLGNSNIINIGGLRRRHSVASQPITTSTCTINPQSVCIVTTNAPTQSSGNNINNNNNNNNLNNIINNNINNNDNNNTTSTTSTTPKSHQRTQSLPLAAINQTQSAIRSILRCATIRDRCDSLPTRARTTSDSQPINPVFHPRNAHLSSHPNRPHSMCGRGMSYSPPVSSMPISPASGACSTDSAGSSLSVDDTVDTVDEPVARFSHSLTPEEPVILEENSDEYGPWSADHATLNNHSPNFKSHSPAQPSSYVDMCSPCGSSPRGGAYVPMSPGGMILCHSRNASLVEEATLPDGYVPMAPRGDDGYVPMDPSRNSPKDIPQLGSLSPVVSGTPSTASRLSEYPLNKVTSYIVPSEDLALRPFRAFSLGSRPDPVNHRHLNRLEITQSDSSRTRAFSVGSKSKIPELGRLSYATITKQSTSNDKSNSAPMLSSSWGHNAAASVHNERMADLMELDFSKNHHTKSISCSPSSRSQSHSYSTAIDTSSYVDMSPGSSGRSGTGNTAPYVDMSGMNKVNRISNGNVGPTTPLSSGAHKPLITTLKPVAEAEGPYMAMEPRRNDWRPMDNSPKQLPSPMQDDYMLMNGPPGVARTAPVDFPQPRQPPEGYVEMVPFNARPALEQDYMNMAMGNTRSRHLQRSSSRKAAGNRSQPIAIKASKPLKTPSFLPLSNSPQSQSLATPTSSTTIFPFSLNSPQSPARSFETPKQTPDSSYSDCSPDVSNYAAMTPIAGIPAPIAMSESPQPLSPVRPPPLKTLASNVPQNTQIPTSSSNNLKLVTSSTSKPQNPANSGDNSKVSNANSSNLPGNSETLPNKVDVAENSTCTPQNSTVSSSEPQSSTVGTSEIPASPLKKRLPDNVEKKKKPTNRSTTSPVTVSVKNEASPSSKHKIEKSSSEGSRESAKDPPQSPITKKFRELSVSSSKLVNTSPNTSPTPTGTLKAKSTSPKVTDEGSTSGTPTPTPTSLDSEGYETLQPGAGCILLNYASLDLPESSSIPPVSPTPAQEAFRYAQIDFAKLKQN